MSWPFPAFRSHLHSSAPDPSLPLKALTLLSSANLTLSPLLPHLSSSEHPCEHPGSTQTTQNSLPRSCTLAYLKDGHCAMCLQSVPRNGPAPALAQASPGMSQPRRRREGPSCRPCAWPDMGFPSVGAAGRPRVRQTGLLLVSTLGEKFINARE